MAPVDPDSSFRAGETEHGCWSIWAIGCRSFRTIFEQATERATEWVTKNTGVQAGPEEGYIGCWEERGPQVGPRLACGTNPWPKWVASWPNAWRTSGQEVAKARCGMRDWGKVGDRGFSRDVRDLVLKEGRRIYLVIWGLAWWIGMTRLNLRRTEADWFTFSIRIPYQVVWHFQAWYPAVKSNGPCGASSSEVSRLIKCRRRVQTDGC